MNYVRYRLMSLVMVINHSVFNSMVLTWWFLTFCQTQPVFTCSKLTIETLEQRVKYVQRRWRRSGMFIVNFEQISHLALVFLLLTLNI